MKRSLKMNLTSILCFIAIVCTILGMGLTMTNATVRADEQVTTFAMEAGVNLKMTDTGMRFKVKMDDQTAKDIKDNDDVTLKFLIGPKVFFDAQTDGQYLEMSQKLTVEVDEAKIYTGADGYKYANGCVYSMKAENLKIDYTAIAVIETVGGTPKYATQADTVRNMYDVVNSALVATEADKKLDNDEIEEVLATYSFIGTADYPINAETAEQKAAIADRAELFEGKSVKVEQELGFVEDVEIYKEGPNASKAVDAEFVKTSDSDVADYASGNVISGGNAGSATLTFKKVIDGIEYFQDITVTVKANPVVVLTTEAVEVDNKELSATYHKTAFAKATLTVDGNAITATKVKWSVKEGYEEYVSVTESGTVEGLKAGSAVVIASYTDDSGVTTSVETNVTINAVMYYGQHESFAQTGIIAALDKKDSKVQSVVYKGIDLANASGDPVELIRLQYIPPENGMYNYDEEKGLPVDSTPVSQMGPESLQITIQDAEDLNNYVIVSISRPKYSYSWGKVDCNQGILTSYVGVRASSWGDYTRDSFFGLNKNGLTGDCKITIDNSWGYGGVETEFSFYGTYLDKQNYEDYMVGVSVQGTAIYLHKGNSEPVKIWDLNSDTTAYKAANSTDPIGDAWTGFTSNKVNVYVRGECYDGTYTKSYIMINKIGGEAVTEASLANFEYMHSSYNGIASQGGAGHKGSPVYAPA